MKTEEVKTEEVMSGGGQAVMTSPNTQQKQPHSTNVVGIPLQQLASVTHHTHTHTHVK